MNRLWCQRQRLFRLDLTAADQPWPKPAVAPQDAGGRSAARPTGPVTVPRGAAASSTSLTTGKFVPGAAQADDRSLCVNCSDIPCCAPGSGQGRCSSADLTGPVRKRTKSVTRRSLVSEILADGERQRPAEPPLAR